VVELLHYALNDNRLAWELDAEGEYIQRRPEPGEPEVNYQALLMRDAQERSRRGGGTRPWELTL
jgi:polyphosphate kinase